MLSRRSAYLAAHGVLYVFLGISLAVFSEPRPQTTVLTAMLPFTAWGGIWFAVGVTSLVSATTSILDKWAFTALSGISAAWAIGLLTGAIITGTPRGAFSFTIFSALAVSHIIVAGVPNSVRLPDSVRLPE